MKFFKCIFVYLLKGSAPRLDTRLRGNDNVVTNLDGNDLDYIFGLTIRGDVWL